MPNPLALAPPLLLSAAPPRAAAVDHGQRDRTLLLDMLRVRDLGGPWFDHPSFGEVGSWDAASAALVLDGLAVWSCFGLDITPRGRRAWADGRSALRALALEITA